MKEVMKYIIIVFILTIIGFTLYNSYKDKRENTIIKNNLYEYFKDPSNTHIGTESFVIDDIRIRCRGINSYIVEFNILFSDDKLNLTDLVALVYKDGKTWKIESSTTAFTTDKIEKYKFMCYE